jgi:hypothetical protein
VENPATLQLDLALLRRFRIFLLVLHSVAVPCNAVTRCRHWPGSQIDGSARRWGHVAGLEAAVNAEGAVEKLPGFAAVTAPAFISAILAVPVATLALWRARLVAW